MNKVNKIRFGDFIILALIIGSAFFLIFNRKGAKDGLVKIQTETSSYIYSLSDDGIYSVPGPIGQTSIEIRNSKVRIIDSPCPNKTCVAQNWGTMLICLPNKIFVTIENEQEEIDAFAE